MRKEIVFATNNQHKLEEIKAILGDKWKILSLNDIDCHDEIEENGATFEENALIKAKYIYEKYHLNCFADDSGLEVKALNNEPGIYSARYNGIDRDSEKNIDKLLKNMEGITDRKARFRTVIAYIDRGNNYYFEGIINGDITLKREGNGGFGYDPVFKPEGYDNTFGELGQDIKNNISHRAIAMQKFIVFLNEQHA